MFPIEWLTQANDRLRSFVTHTPITYDGDHHLLIKWESYQITGSFKVRGALNRVFNLQDWEVKHGLVTTSAGNHGQGLAYAGKIARVPVKVFVPENASKLKVERIQALGATVGHVPGDYGRAERAGKQYAEEHGVTWVSPYNDSLVIAGQSTVAQEVILDFPEAIEATWIVPIGGGGLISGIAVYLASLTAKPRIIGVQAEASPFFYHLQRWGSQTGAVDLPTLADGLAGAVEAGSITIPIVGRYVEDIVLVSEQELVDAVRYAWEFYGEPIEPSGAAGLAAALSGKIDTRPSVVIVTGGNISAAAHLALINSQINAAYTTV
jgi:threonine dehydratase